MIKTLSNGSGYGTGTGNGTGNGNGNGNGTKLSRSIVPYAQAGVPEKRREILHTDIR